MWGGFTYNKKGRKRNGNGCGHPHCSDEQPEFCTTMLLHLAPTMAMQGLLA